MKFNSLTQAHIKAFQSMVDADRFSTGESVLDLHARDQSSHPRSRPEAVIWPLSAAHGSSLQWMQRVKSLFDPNGILNPGKIFPDG